MDAKIRKLQRQIQSIKKELMALEDLRPGTLSKQYNVCGSPGCRCKANPPKKHGPYYQLSWTRNAKSTTRFVRQTYVPQVRREVKNYQRLQSLVTHWVDLSAQICELRLKQGRER